MPAFSVSKSVHIDAPCEQVYDSVLDFKQWKAWSPWLVAEPDCPLDFDEDGKGYHWDGDVIGAGSMRVSGESRASSIDHDLAFLRPFKSEAKVRFEFKAEKGGTRVTWNLDSSLPFFLFWMTKLMTAMIGSDYQRGLLRLKDHIEMGRVPSEIEFAGTEECPAYTLLGAQDTVSMDDMSRTMADAMERLQAYMEENKLKPVGPPMTVYHKWKLTRGEATFTIGFPVKEAPSPMPTEFIRLPIMASKRYLIRHTGPYRHLADGWAAGYTRGQSKVFRQNKSAHPYEIYERFDDDPASEENVTLIHFPVK